MPEDTLKKYVSMCIGNQVSQPVEMKTAMKDTFKFLKWKLTEHPADFTEEDAVIINLQDISQYFSLSPKSCTYTKNCIKKYTELIWHNKLKNQYLMDGESHIPRPSCSRLPIPIRTSRADEVLLMSTMYPQNLMNSFVYRHTYNAESPLCSLCRREEQTSHHVICVCNDKREEIKQVMCDLIGEEEVQKEDCTTLLNCSRDRKFIQLCLEVLQDGDFRREIDIIQLYH